MKTEMLDNFTDPVAWIPVASGPATLTIAADSGSHANTALRLDFDFKGGGGFVVARRELARWLPPTFTLSLGIRGEAPPNKLEVKLVDTSGCNVWWYRRDVFNFPKQWERLTIPSREFEFAWGPAGGGTLEHLGAIEIAIVAASGGRGHVWIESLDLEDRSQHPAPSVTRGRTQGREWMELDLHEPREHGGFTIVWNAQTGARAFDLHASDDGVGWTTIWSAPRAAGERSYVYAPGGASVTRLRVELHEPSSGRENAIESLEIEPFDVSRTIDAFFRSVAAREPRGRFPRWLHGEQAYWTPVASAEGGPQALLNEDGLVEVSKGSFSLEPLLAVDGKLITWADVNITQALEGDHLPIPSAVWRCGNIALRTTVWVASLSDTPVVLARYRVESHGTATVALRLYIAVRPVQVDPSWQAFRGMGGVSRVERIELVDGVVWVNDACAIVPLGEPAPSGFGAVTFDEGPITAHVTRGELPPATSVDDTLGYGSAALAYDLAIEPERSASVWIAVPFGSVDVARRDEVIARLRSATTDTFERETARAAHRWERALAGVDLVVPPSAHDVTSAVKTAAAHILVNRNGPALQPGPRRYSRSWIRDGAIMAAAALRMGWHDEVRDFIRWYASHQAADGNVPCCVDETGPDWLAEHDSHGQLLFTIMEHYRFARDHKLLVETWPCVRRTVGYLEKLRAARVTPEYERGTIRACHGLLPESVSHEGYLAQPVHAYWDNFWAVRGLGDAAEIATTLGEFAEAQRFADLHASLERSLYASIDTLISEKGLAYIPGSVEWADFDPTATASALQITDAAKRLPSGKLNATYEQYLTGFRARRDGASDWSNYTAYEIRIIGALVRLGRCSEAHELLEFFLHDRRPRAWNQWPEISWRDPRSPGHLGDIPHSWIGAEYVLAVMSLFAYERHSDQALVLAAGVPESWLADDGVVGVRNLQTYYGPLSYTLRRTGSHTVKLTLDSPPITPPGGIIVSAPPGETVEMATRVG